MLKIGARKNESPSIPGWLSCWDMKQTLCASTQKFTGQCFRSPGWLLGRHMSRWMGIVHHVATAKEQIAPACKVCVCTWQFQRRAATSTRVAFNHASNTAMFASGDYLICMFMERNQPETSTPLICIATHTSTPEGAFMDF